MKVGTGHGDTIQGHIYLRNLNFLDTPAPPVPTAAEPTNSVTTTALATAPVPAATASPVLDSNATSSSAAPTSTSTTVKDESTDNKSRRWLVCIRNKLFLYCGLIQKSTESGKDNSSGYIIHSISSLSLREEPTEKIVLSSPNPNPQDAVIGDGRFLYVIKTKGQVEVFDPAKPRSTNILESITTVTLTAPSVTPPPSAPPAPFPTLFLEKSGWYITGRQLVCVVAPETWGASEYLSRVWAIPNGTHVLDVTSKAKPPAPVACYDAHNNVMWCYDENSNKIAEYMNSGPMASVVDVGSVFPTPYPAFSPENILSSQECTGISGYHL